MIHYLFKTFLINKKFFNNLKEKKILKLID